jgi:hypothetical protein
MSHHHPVKTKRLFRPGKRYSEINWKNFREVVSEFKGRIDAWYLQPARAISALPDAAFAEMALTCLLIDTLSQYRYGALQSPTEVVKNCTNKTLESSHFKFEDFLAERIPSLSAALPVPIKTGRTKNGKAEELKTYAEVLYSGFRCGILHEAHVPLYGAISGQTPIVSWHKSGITKYADGTQCPTVVVFPKHLLDALSGVFVSYIDELLNQDPQYNDLRLRFKEKFEQSFGVTISTTP